MSLPEGIFVALATTFRLSSHIAIFLDDVSPPPN